jgi:phosphatidylinositol-3,4,5-trisphosphate 3-phosphatase/dual-specificity protein phosphatase PTEN
MLRNWVSGPKNRFKEDGYNLDLTYVCPRLVGMAYPAKGIESIYRNPINIVKIIKILLFLKI